MFPTMTSSSAVLSAAGTGVNIELQLVANRRCRPSAPLFLRACIVRLFRIVFLQILRKRDMQHIIRLQLALMKPGVSDIKIHVGRPPPPPPAPTRNP